MKEDKDRGNMKDRGGEVGGNGRECDGWKGGRDNRGVGKERKEKGKIKIKKKIYENERKIWEIKWKKI